MGDVDQSEPFYGSQHPPVEYGGGRHCKNNIVLYCRVEYAHVSELKLFQVQVSSVRNVARYSAYVAVIPWEIFQFVHLHITTYRDTVAWALCFVLTDLTKNCPH